MEKDRQNIRVGDIPMYFEDKQIRVPDVQREDTVWTEDQKQMLIDSLYNDYDIPKVYVREDANDPGIWWLLDGQQRLTAIKDFMTDKFTLADYSTLPNELHDKFYSELSTKDKSILKSRSLDFIVLKCTEEEEEDLFLRLNGGTPLNAAEKRNAIKGEFKDMIRELVDHKFFDKKINFPTKRFAVDAVCSQITLLALNEGPVDAKGRQLRDLYEKNKRFPERSNVQSDVTLILNLMDKIFEDRERYMKKYNVISIFLLLFEIKHSFSVSGISTQEIYEFIHSFELSRVKNNQKSEDDIEFDRDLNSYARACVNSPDSKESIRVRHEVLLKKFLQQFQDIAPKDSTRNFTISQKEAIYYLCDKKCQSVGGVECPNKGVRLPFEECEFDHKQEFEDGGKTTVSNGQLLCHDCHAFKTAHSRRARK